MEDEIQDPQGLDTQDPQSPQGEPQSQADDFDPNGFGYVFRGETHYPKDRNDLIELSQLGHLFRTKRDHYDKIENEYKTLSEKNRIYQQFEQALNQNPQLAEEIRNAYQKYSQQQPNGQGAAQPGDPRYEELHSKVQTIEERHADQELRREMDSLRKNHPDHDWDKDTGEGNFEKQILKFMIEQGINNPEHAYRAFMFPQAVKTANFKGAERLTIEQQRAKKAGIVNKGNQGPKKASSFDPRGKSYSEALDAALSEVGSS